jgi:predicted GNAT superfamily acetyltransferase
VADVAIRELHDLPELRTACAVLDEVWRTPPGTSEVQPALLRALVHAGSYVVGAFDGPEMVGASVAFFATVGDAPAGRGLHSHITGVLPAGRGIGLAMKRHQRDWALARGIDKIMWTFDPLIARNAWFNVARLGARPVAYHVDFYGEMTDARNAGQPTDRMTAVWDLTAPLPAAPAPTGVCTVLSDAGGPQRHGIPDGTAPLAVQLPPDIEAVRLADPAAALRWRLALREVLTELLDRGYGITGFDRERRYLLTGRDSG